MLRYQKSPQEDHDDHLRSLLDQRTNRAHLHGRHSPISQFSDTPSVYSRSFFSPKPTDKSCSDSYHIDPQHRFHSPAPHPYRNNRDDPAASMLDFDDDTGSSLDRSETHEADDQQSFIEDEEDEPSISRMSLLGPKMRFHSRAPWEMESATLEEDDEDEEQCSFPFTHTKDYEHRGVAGASSPRMSKVSRPSGESVRSQVAPKRSFDTASSHQSYSRGALYALAQESLSASSLGRSGKQEGLRAKFGMGRMRSRSPTGSLLSHPVSPIPQSPHHFPTASTSTYDAHDIPADNRNYNSSTSSMRNSAASSEDIHPYANPDLVIYANPAPKSAIRAPFDYAGVARSNSTATVTDASTQEWLSVSGTRSTLAADGSAASLAPRSKTFIQRKEISSPVSMHSNHLLPDTSDYRTEPTMSPLLSSVNKLPGWTEHVPPTFGLISLEEARAQRSRSATTHIPTSRSSESASSVSGSIMPIMSVDRDNMSIMSGYESSSAHISSRARSRSISAGAKAKNAIQTIVGQVKPERRESEPAVVYQQSSGGAQGKTLKHKKSGFMRLFNAARSQEKDDKHFPPPVPLLSDAYAAHNARHAPRVSKPQRIPAPIPSPSTFELPQETMNETPAFTKPFPSPKKTLPPLSINTTSGYNARPPATFAGEQARALSAAMPDKPWQNDTQSHSAPPDVSEFPALKLRPVSTLFSAHFGDHIVLNSQPGLETDVSTPRSSSPTGITSPMTPGSFSRPSAEHITLLTGATDDQSSVVRALQDQFTSAKKTWQRQVFELEGQIRDLKAELEDRKAVDQEHGYCDSCGRGRELYHHHDDAPFTKPVGVVNRPRARTGNTSRFGNALP